MENVRDQALLESMKQTDPVQSVKVYLEAIRATDPQLDESLNNPEKSFEKCWTYISAKAKKELENKSGAISSVVVFGWAIHYFTESDETLAEESKQLGIVQRKPVSETPVVPQAPKPTPVVQKPSVVKQSSSQLDLFSFMDSSEEPVEGEEDEEESDDTDEHPEC
jgi:hypothetical protein